MGLGNREFNFCPAPWIPFLIPVSSVAIPVSNAGEAGIDPGI